MREGDGSDRVGQDKWGRGWGSRAGPQRQGTRGDTKGAREQRRTRREGDDKEWTSKAIECAAHNTQVRARAVKRDKQGQCTTQKTTKCSM